MIDIDTMKYFLGIEVEQLEQGIFISQHKYATDVLKRFRIENKEYKGYIINPTLYKKLVGSLMYLIATRLDIMESPKDSH